MRAKLVVLIIVICCAALGVWLDQTHFSAPEEQPMSLCYPAPETGRTVCLPDHSGRVTLINFWASWCPPCINELPGLLELARQNPDQFHLMLVSGDIGETEMQEFLATFDNGQALKLKNVTAIFDAGRRHAAANAVRQYPESILLDRQGRVNARYSGALTSPKLRDIQTKIGQ